MDANLVYMRPISEGKRDRYLREKGALLIITMEERASTRAEPATCTGPRSCEHEEEEPSLLQLHSPGQTHALPTPMSLHLFWSAEYARPGCSWDLSLVHGHGTHSPPPSTVPPPLFSLPQSPSTRPSSSLGDDHIHTPGCPLPVNTAPPTPCSLRRAPSP